jgi:hypothetical protein
MRLAATRVALKTTATPRGWSLWRAKLGRRGLSARRCPRMLFPARLLHLRPIPRQPGKLLQLGLPRPCLLLLKMSRRETTLLLARPLTRPAKKVRARSRWK